ncbi:MAG TPA: NFACT family protein [Candidatus Nanoarchaeia archaeon]|nr:NFACT family protein [Candidatus Nanoarchaeia archaeon]
MNIINPQLSSIELRAVVLEMQHLRSAKIDQIYEQNGEFYFRIHSLRGKEILCVRPGKYIYLSAEKPAMEQPSGFCMQLRKHLAQARISAVTVVDGQRIAVFDLDTKDAPYRLIVELFAKGNIVLCKRKEIIGLLNQIKMTSRELFVGNDYVEPLLDNNVIGMYDTELGHVLAQSTKDSLVTAIAADVGLGGQFAEEVCFRATIDKKKNPQTLAEKEVHAVARVIDELMREAPRGYIYEHGVCAPVELRSLKLVETLDTFNAALEKLLAQLGQHREKIAHEAKFGAKMEKLHHILQQQEEKLHEIDTRVDEFTRKGDLVYERYSDVHALLSAVAELRKDGWDKVKTFLADKKLKADLKEKKVVMEL